MSMSWFQGYFKVLDLQKYNNKIAVVGGMQHFCFIWVLEKSYFCLSMTKENTELLLKQYYLVTCRPVFQETYLKKKQLKTSVYLYASLQMLCFESMKAECRFCNALVASMILVRQVFMKEQAQLTRKAEPRYLSYENVHNCFCPNYEAQNLLSAKSTIHLCIE